MVLKILATVGDAILPSKYYTHAVLAVIGLITIYTYAQGRQTTRERDLHGRTILVTVACPASILRCSRSPSMECRVHLRHMASSFLRT